MTSDTLWLVMALVLIVEGLLPLLAPHLWRQVMQEMLKQDDQRLRQFGLIAVASGLLLWLL